MEARIVFFCELTKKLRKLCLLPGLIKSERPKSISFISASSLPEVKRKFCNKRGSVMSKHGMKIPHKHCQPPPPMTPPGDDKT